MLNQFKGISSNNNKSKQQDKESGIQLSISGNANININQDILIKLIAWLLGGSLIITTGLNALPKNNPPPKHESSKEISVEK